MKPCIFLDIDGVINPSCQQAQYRIDYSLPEKVAKEKNNPKIAQLNMYLVNQIYYNFHPESIAYIHKLIEEFDVNIIITSSWRIIYSLEELKTMFSIFDLGQYIQGVTQKISPRMDAIQSYIDKNKIKAYLILDDFDMSSVFHYRFIYVHNYFKEEDYQKARYALSIQLGE